MVRTILMVLLIIISVVLTVIILFQEGKTAGLGSLSGQNMESYWAKNKGRSKEGVLVKFTTLAVVLFFIISAVLNIAAI